SSVLGLTRDITHIKRAAQIEHWEGHVTSLISQGASLRQVLDHIITGLEALLPGTIGSVMVMEEDGLHLRHGAAPGLPSSYTRAIDGLRIGPSVGSCGTAAFLGKRVIVDDIATDPLWADFQDIALGHNLRACW